MEEMCLTPLKKHETSNTIGGFDSKWLLLPVGMLIGIAIEKFGWLNCCQPSGSLGSSVSHDNLGPSASGAGGTRGIFENPIKLTTGSGANATTKVLEAGGLIFDCVDGTERGHTFDESATRLGEGTQPEFVVHRFVEGGIGGKPQDSCRIISEKNTSVEFKGAGPNGKVKTFKYYIA